MVSNKFSVLCAASIAGLMAMAYGGPAEASWQDYSRSTCSIESNCRNNATNDNSTATGRYQLTQGALEDIGLFESNGSIGSEQFGKGEWTNGQWKENQFGVTSREEFMNNPQAQEWAFQEYSRKNWETLEAIGATEYVGSTIDGVVIDDAALLAGAHLIGAGGMKKFLEEGGFSSEALRNHPELARMLKERMEEFSGTDISELTGREYQPGMYASELSGGGAPGDMDEFFCDPEIARALAESAQASVDAQVALASQEGVGFSQPPESYGFLSCLEDLLSGGIDGIFSPPTLGDILGMLEDFVCQQADVLYAEMVEQPINQALAQVSTSAEGFAPIPGMGNVITGSSASFRFNRSATGDDPLDRLDLKVSGDGKSNSLFDSRLYENSYDQFQRLQGITMSNGAAGNTGGD